MRTEKEQEEVDLDTTHDRRHAYIQYSSVSNHALASLPGRLFSTAHDVVYPHSLFERVGLGSGSGMTGGILATADRDHDTTTSTVKDELYAFVKGKRVSAGGNDEDTCMSGNLIHTSTSLPFQPAIISLRRPLSHIKSFASVQQCLGF